MAIDADALLAPVSDDQPCGVDLSLDAERRELERTIASATRIEYDANTGAPKPPPEIDWERVIGGIAAQFARTKDISLAVDLCRAGVLGKQLDVAAQGAKVLDGLVERYWDAAYPLPDESGVLERSASCGALGHTGMFLNPLERIPLLAHPRLGIFTGADLRRLSKGAEAEGDFGLFRQALDELGDAPLKSADALLREIDDALVRAAHGFAAKTPDGTSPAFKPVHDTIAALRGALGGFFKTPAAENAPDAGEAQALQPGASRGAAGDTIASRDDVLRALDAIADYYRRREPASPILPLIERAKAWVPMPFLEVLEDIAPDSLAAARLVLSRRPSN